MLRDRISNPGSLALQSVALPIALSSPALNTGINRSEQTVQTRSNCFCRSSLIRVYTVCHFTCNFFAILHSKTNCSIFRTIVVIILGVPIFRILIVSCYLFWVKRPGKILSSHHNSKTIERVILTFMSK